MIEKYAGKNNSKYKIFITNKIIPSIELNKYINKTSKVLIITDSGIPKKYIQALKVKIKNAKVYLHTIPQGEASKSFKIFQEIIKKLISLNFSRTDIIIAFGGGVVGDISGFAASSFLRGIDYCLLYTSPSPRD